MLYQLQLWVYGAGWKTLNSYTDPEMAAQHLDGLKLILAPEWKVQVIGNDGKVMT